MAAADESSPKPSGQRTGLGDRLGLPAAVAIVIANMIGTGVFTSAGYQAQGLHDPLTMILTWVVGGVVALAGAAAYAELGAMMPRVGGEYVYLREAYHPVVGVMSGWASLVAGFSAPIAAAAIAFAAYLAAVVPALAGSQPLVAIGLIAAMTLLHAFDTVIGGRVQTVLTAGKVLLIAAFIVLGLAVGDGSWDHFASQHGGLDNVYTMEFAVALMFVGFAYSGWNAAAYIAGEIKDPTRNVPRALLLGTSVVMALYILLNVVFLYAVPVSLLAEPVREVGDAAARALFGPSAGSLLSTLIALALISTVSAMVMAGPRVYAAMAEDRALPALFARKNRGGVPVVAVVAQGVLATGFVLVARLDQLVRMVGYTLAIFAALTVAAVFVLRRTRPGAARPYRTWGYPVTPVLFIAVSLWVIYAQTRSNLVESLIGLGALAAVAAVYALTARRRA
jgi:APA family basic amino acid/polyamine antiporter